MADTYFPWMDTLKSELQNAVAVAKAADQINNCPVYGFEEWPATLPGMCILVGITETWPDYSAGGPCITLYTVRIFLFAKALSLAESQRQLTPMIKIIRDELAGALQLGGTVDHILPTSREGAPISGPGVARYGDGEYPALIFNYEVKVNETGDFTVSA